MGERVRVMRYGGRLVAAKEPNGDDATALRNEAEVLLRVQVPGVVELVGVRSGDDPVLLTHWVGPRSLNDVSVPMPVSTAAATVVAVAATVGRLHRAGIVHGALDPTHVLLDADGRPVLCGFGSAGPIGSPVRRPATDPGPVGSDVRTSVLRPSTDVAGLGLLLEHLLGTSDARSGARPWSRSDRLEASQRRRLRVVAAQAAAPDPADRPSVSAFTLAVRRAVPGARLGDGATSPSPLADPTSRPRPRPRTGRASVPGPSHARARPPVARRNRLSSALPALVALTLIGATTYFGLRSWWDPGPDTASVATPMAPPTRPAPTTTSTASTSTTTVPSAATTAAPVVEHGGRQYQVGAGGDVVAVGDWLCDGRDLAAVLRPADGSVHLFSDWAPDGGSLAARAVVTVPGADELAAAAAPDGCVDLVVTGAGSVLARLTDGELR